MVTMENTQVVDNLDERDIEIQELRQALEEALELNQNLTLQGQELVKVQTTLQSLLHTATDPVIQFNPDGSIMNFNSAAQRVFGYSEIELLYQSAEKIISCPPNYGGNVPKFLLDCQENIPSKDGVIPVIARDRNGNSLCLECSISFVKKNDMMLFDDSAADNVEVFDDIFLEEELTAEEPSADLPVQGESVEGEALEVTNENVAPLADEYISMMIILRDVTERVQVERDLIDAINQAEKALSVKSSFIATMSHELRTPMNGIIGGLQILKDADLTNEHDNVLGTVIKSSESLLDIINEVLDFSKMEAGKDVLNKERFRLTYLVEDVLEMFILSMQEKGLELKYQIDKSVPASLYSDPVKLKQILVNLIGNAIKFTEDGTISVLIKALEPLSNTDPAMLSICISDTGVGISRVDQDKLFQPFQQADDTITREFGGTGLGLSICKKIAELMQGEIILTSELGQGSSFDLQIPLEDSENDTQADAIPSQVFAGKSVVICSQKTALRNKIANQCTQWGIDHRMVDNLTQVLKLSNKIAQGWLIVTSEEVLQEQVEKDFFNQVPKLNVIFCGNEINNGLMNKRFKLEARADYLSLPVFTKHLRDVLVKEPVVEETADDKSYDQTICITDDNQINRVILDKILTKLGCTSVIQAKDGQEAIAMVREHAPELIFMDLQMPVMDGHSATKAILAHNENPPKVIALTANISEEDVKASYEAGMIDFLTKPVRIDKIAEILQKHLD